MKVSITNLQEYGRGYQWTVTDEYGDTGDYSTNREGEGLFRWNKYGTDYNQIEGTCQFSLHQKTRSGVRQAIRRYFEG